MKAFQNQTAALRMPLSAFGAVRRPLFWMGCAFLLTVWLLLALPGWAVLPCAAGGVLCIGWLSRGSLRHFLPLLALFSLLGLAVVLCHRWLAQARLLPLLAPDRPVSVTLTIEKAVQRGAYRRYSGRAVLESDAGRAAAEAVVSGYTEEFFSPGETLRCEAVCPEPPKERELLSDSVRLRLVRLIPGDPLDSPHFTARLIRWRAFLADRIHTFAPGETGAVLAAMLVGDRSRLSAGLNASFRRSGLSHLLVVSGLHLVILSRMVWLFLAPFVRERRRAFFLIGFCWGFALLTGAGSSVVRAAVMLTLAQIGDLLGRRGDTLTSLSVAGVLMAVQNPGAILTASFQLSFGAVAGIALLSAPIERLLAGEAPGAVRSWLAANLSAGLAAQAGAAPVLLATFGLFPLLGIAANLLVVGIIAPMMTLGLLSLFFSFAFPGLCAILLPACRGLALLLILTARFFSALPFAQMGISFRWQTAGLAGLLCLAVLLLARRPGRDVFRAALLGWCAVFLTAAVLSAALFRSHADLLITEKGAVSVSRGTRAVVLGTPADIWEADALADALTRLGVQQIDGVLLSDGERAELPLFRLLGRFGGKRRVASSDSLALRRFCSAARLIPCGPPDEALLFGAAELLREGGGYRIVFSEASLLKSEQECAIIGKYGRALPLGETIAHLRVRLEDIP